MISRSSSIVKYSMQYDRESVLPVSLSLPRCFNGRVYDYSENKIMSFQNDDFKNPSTKEFRIGNVRDYYKLGKDFYFIKNGKDSRLVLLLKEHQSASPKTLLVFWSLYYFDNEFIFIIEDRSLIRVSLKTLDRKVVCRLTADPLMMCCRFLGEDRSTDSGDETDGNSMPGSSNDIVAYTDSRNRLHIHHGKDYRSYHWLSNKAEHLSVCGDYIVVASRSGDVVKFHSSIQRIEPLFKFDEEFVDMKIGYNKLYLLSASQFFVFDLESQSLVHKDTLVIPADYKVCDILARPPKEDSRDIFSIKKQSKVEIFDSLNLHSQKESSDSKPFIVYACHRHVYLFDPVEKMLVSQFLLDSELNYVSNSKVLAFTHKRTSMIVRIFSIFQDRLVLSSNRMILSRDRVKITNAYYVQGRIFIEVPNSLCYINKLNLIEILNKSSSPLNIRQERDGLFIIDERGVFDVIKREYIIKQKRSTNFCVFKGFVVFFIEDKGLYVDLPERKQILEVKSIIDIKSEVESGEEVLKIIRLADGRCLMEDYGLSYDGDCIRLDKRSEKVVENSCFKILCNNICATKSNQMVIT